MFLQTSKISMQAVIKHFGKGYVLTRYDFCPGFDDAEAAPVYESPQGSATYMEYRSQGIAILVDAHGTVNDLRYLEEPVGFSSRRECPDVQAKQQTPSNRP